MTNDAVDGGPARRESSGLHAGREFDGDPADGRHVEIEAGQFGRAEDSHRETVDPDHRAPLGHGEARLLCRLHDGEGVQVVERDERVDVRCDLEGRCDRAVRSDGRRSRRSLEHDGRFESVPLHGSHESAGPPRRLFGVGRVDHHDAAAPGGDEVGDGRVESGFEVDLDDATLSGFGRSLQDDDGKVSEHVVEIGRRQTEVPDDRVDLTGELSQEADVITAVVGSVRDEDVPPGRGGGFDDSVRELGEVGIDQSFEDEPQRRTVPDHEAAPEATRPVVELFRDLEHAFACRLADPHHVVHGPRHGLSGDPGDTSDVDDRRSFGAVVLSLHSRTVATARSPSVVDTDGFRMTECSHRDRSRTFRKEAGILNEESGGTVEKLSRRAFLAGSAGVGGAALAVGLTGCTPTLSISSDPKVLTLWSWSRAVSTRLLKTAEKAIPGSTRRIRSDIIGGNFDVKLRTSMAGRAFIPDVTALNSNVSSYFPIEDQFLDLNDLGAQDRKADYLDWKWALGTTPSGRQCFWPMDTAPMAFWFRRDIFSKAGLPSDPAEVSATISSWDHWLEAGAQLKKNARASIIANSNVAFTAVLACDVERYFSPAGKALYQRDGSAVRRAWDVAVKASTSGITAKALTDPEKNSAYNNGKTPANLEGSWWSSTLKAIAPDDSGKWGAAKVPGGYGNNGGSFLALPKSTKNPQAAFEFLTWLTSATNQVTSYTELQIFPSTPKSFDSPVLAARDPYFAKQDTLSLFSEAAAKVPKSFFSPYESYVSTGILSELFNVETQGKDPERAWDDAMAQADRQLTKKGLES
jgi:cellobiose transport system substrate-binding protein